MNLDTALIIPHLSKELNLIGHPTLPFTLKKKHKGSKTNGDDNNFDIVFNSKKMLETLVSVCMELVKQVKTSEFNYDSNEIEKIKFQNLKLNKQIELSKTELVKKNCELETEKQKCLQLNMKIEELEKKVKHCTSEKNKEVKKNSINEGILKHKLKKKDSDLLELHKTLWKQFNLADQNFFPENFEIVKIDQPDFNKLWSDVKYSSTKNKEEALKKAVCIFQENNNCLMKDNILLKNLLLITLHEVNDITVFILDKMHLNGISLGKDKIKEIFKELESVNVAMYKHFLQDHFDLLRKIFYLFQDVIFSVSDDYFICWSDVIKKAKGLIESDVK